MAICLAGLKLHSGTIEQDSLDDITTRIYNGNFTSKEERDSLYRKGVEMCIAEGVRAWVATRLDSYVLRADIRRYTNDVGAGLRGIWNLRELRAPGKTTLNVGHLWVYTARTVWNQVGGFQDVYSVDIMYSTWDPMTWTHPFNGLPIPFRSSFDVQTAGPTGKLDAPSDAFIWDASRGAWKLVGPELRLPARLCSTCLTILVLGGMTTRRSRGPMYWHSYTSSST